jgi:apolipoprotein N-acyltransferase
VQTVAFVWTAAWPLQLLCVAALGWRVVRQTPLRAAGLGLVYGTAWLGAGTWWLFVSLHVYGGLPAWLAALSVALLSASLSIYLAAAMAAFVALRRGRPAADAALFAALWLLAELARGVFFTGFPWIASGYAHVDSPLAGFAPWIGVYGVGALGALLAAAVVLQRADGDGRWVRAGLVALLVLAGGHLLKGIEFTEPSGRLAATCSRATCRRTRSSPSSACRQRSTGPARRCSPRRATSSSRRRP